MWIHEGIGDILARGAICSMGLSAAFRADRLFLTEGGVGQRIEWEYGYVPDPDILYAALIYHEDSRKVLRKIYSQYLTIAQQYAMPILLMTNTRRANEERVLRSPYRRKNVMRDYAEFLRDIRAGFSCEAYIGGMMGCKGNAYSGNEGLSTAEATAFHTWQAEQFIGAPIDYLFAGIMPSKQEAMGMAGVMAQTGMPYIISFMVGRRGLLLDGTSIHSAIEAIDAYADPKPLCYMANCVHPDIMRESLAFSMNRTPLVRQRFRGLQANAALLQPSTLDQREALHSSAPKALVNAFEALYDVFPLSIVGGCCGTDHRHIEELARRFQAKMRA